MILAMVVLIMLWRLTKMSTYLCWILKYILIQEDKLLNLLRWGLLLNLHLLVKKTAKKDLGLIAMTYGHVYVASVALGADKNQVVKALKEAESYKGPSLIIGYSSCINHGIKKGMMNSQEEAKKAVAAGYWFNYRFDPRLKLEDKNPFQLDSKPPSGSLEEYLEGQVRYNYLKRIDPEAAKKLYQELKAFLENKYKFYREINEKKIF